MSEIIKTIHVLPNRAVNIQNELNKHVLAPIPFLPFKNSENVKDIQDFDTQTTWRADTPLSEQQQYFPFSGNAITLDFRPTRLGGECH